jgi:23S rRNA (uridine2552-2'-O)-methyltransferase
MTDYKKPDYWQQKARKEGYPARSVYKLMEIDKKFNLFKIPRSNTPSGQVPKGLPSFTVLPRFAVLDLGAAPGSWSLYVLRNLQRNFSHKKAKDGFLTAADLTALSREYDNGLFDGDNFSFIQGDITTEDVRKTIFEKGPYSVIISDAAPATTGNHTVDAARSFDLAEIVIDYAISILIPGGNLALKVFQGGDSAQLLKQMKILFETAKSFKPQACRGESVETYYIGLNKK